MPNLDFKFVTANTLIPLPDQFISGSSQQDIFDGSQSNKIALLKELREEYFSSHHSNRSEIKAKFRLVQNEIWSEMHKSNSYGKQSLALSDWDPFSHKATKWFDPDWIFGVNDGFDITIANPPWVSLMGKHALSENKKNKPALIALYAGNTYMPNLYEYFTARSINLLSDRGCLSFVVPDRFAFNESSSDLRRNILTQSSLESITYKWKFEGVIADTMTILLSKIIPSEEHSIQMKNGPGDTPMIYTNNELLKRADCNFRTYKDIGTKKLVEKIKLGGRNLNTHSKTT